MKLALTVAGSDPSGGAGIQGDLRTFLALGVYGFSAITALTVQNTRQVSGVVPVEPEAIRGQIDAILSDASIDAVKVGMVYSKEAIHAVAESIRRLRVPVVVDPILYAGSGARLLEEDAVESFVAELIPIATLVTPNKAEAELLSGQKIASGRDPVSAAHSIRDQGAKNVIVKGGHLGGKESVDTLVESDGQTFQIRNPRIATERTHGSGCNFSAAAASFLSRGLSVRQSCILAADFVKSTLSAASAYGRGSRINMPPMFLTDAAGRFEVITALQQAVEVLVPVKNFHRLIPETQTNFGYALSLAESLNDVAAVRGRIARSGERAAQVGPVEFGSSRHVASAILAAMKHDPRTRSAINIRYDRRLLEIARKQGFKVGTYDRSQEPQRSKSREGSTVSWGITSALTATPGADLVYHLGDLGKEPMIMIFGRKPDEIVGRVRKLASSY